ncbi:hypothetical protein AB0G35_07830 [Streptomyces sp. NPDC021749]|uniref:hypothetical protein n=1 Tax=Streptomyces sp. NPDC021749 TaxID=3154905 RepID=UPI0033C2F9CA
MSRPHSRPGTHGAGGGGPFGAARSGPGAWARDLATGMRFAAGGGREGWIRTALTAAGVALGVAVLLLGTSVPHLMDAWHGREKARENLGQEHPPRPSDTTLRYASTDTTFHGIPVRGRLVRPDGTRPPVPPGIDHLPGPGRMLVSPALKELLGSPGGALLRARLPYEIAGTIGDAGLLGPKELTYVAQSDTLAAPDGYRIDHFGEGWEPRPMSAPAVLLVIMACVALMTPVMVFIGTSVRFGNERRERRLAALRLVGADVPTTRRIASGEALFGSLLGVAGGAALFLAARGLAPLITLWDINGPAARRPGLLATGGPQTPVEQRLGHPRGQRDHRRGGRRDRHPHADDGHAGRVRRGLRGVRQAAADRPVGQRQGLAHDPTGAHRAAGHPRRDGRPRRHRRPRRPAPHRPCPHHRRAPRSPGRGESHPARVDRRRSRAGCGAGAGRRPAAGPP